MVVSVSFECSLSAMLGLRTIAATIPDALINISYWIFVMHLQQYSDETHLSAARHVWCDADCCWIPLASVCNYHQIIL